MERRGFRRAEGLRNVEGHLTKPFLNGFMGEAELGEPLRGACLRRAGGGGLADAGPCGLRPAMLPSFRRLECACPGWNRRARETLGGALGCAHPVDPPLRPSAPCAGPRLPIAAAGRRRNRRPTHVASELRAASRSGPPAPNAGREGASRLRRTRGRARRSRTFRSPAAAPIPIARARDRPALLRERHGSCADDRRATGPGTSRTRSRRGNESRPRDARPHVRHACAIRRRFRAGSARRLQSASFSWFRLPSFAPRS